MAGKGKKATHDVAPIVRASFLSALERIKQEDGKTFSEIIADWMRVDPGAVLNAVAKFTVKEAAITGQVEVNNVIDITDTERASRIMALLERGRETRDRQTLDAGTMDAITRATDDSTQH